MILVLNANRLISDEQKNITNIFYKITLNSSETVVKLKLPLQ